MDPTTVYVVSDSLGETAEQVARAALTQFEPELFRVVRAPRMVTPRQLEEWTRSVSAKRCVVFHTLAAPGLRDAMDELVAGGVIHAVDVLGPAILAVSEIAREEPRWRSGDTMRSGRGYLQWFEALEFAFRHDDGKHSEELSRADIVLVGASRTSKTPLSMYLAFRGHAVANVPLGTSMEPPEELFGLDPDKVFGLMTDPDLLVRIRGKRATAMGPYGTRYASREVVEEDLEAARAVMRRLGCTVVVTGDRAIEEAAQEIIRHLERE